MMMMILMSNPVFNRHFSSSQLCVITVFLSLICVAATDYPPSSEDRSGYYNSGKGQRLHDEDPTKFGSRFISSRNSITNFNHYHSGKPSKHVGRSLERGFYRAWDSTDTQWPPGMGPSSVLSSSSFNDPKCVPIPSNMTLCKKLEYNKMLIPNLLDHDTVTEATQQSNSWMQLVMARCHADTQIFLCSLFAPVCYDVKGVQPCRSLCEGVRDSCQPVMLRHGFPWPEMFRCDKFPESGQLCIDLRSKENGKEDKTCGPCKRVTSFNRFLDLYCKADYVLKASVDQSVVSGEDLKMIISKEKTKVVKFVPSKSWKHHKRLKEQIFFVKEGSDCDCSYLETINGVRDNSTLLVIGSFPGDETMTGVINSKEGETIDTPSSSDVSRKKENGHKDKFYVTSILSFSKDIKKMLNKIKAGESQLDSLCKNRPKVGNEKDTKIIVGKTSKVNGSKRNEQMKSSSKGLINGTKSNNKNSKINANRNLSKHPKRRPQKINRMRDQQKLQLSH